MGNQDDKTKIKVHLNEKKRWISLKKKNRHLKEVTKYMREIDDDATSKGSPLTRNIEREDTLISESESLETNFLRVLRVIAMAGKTQRKIIT